VDWLWWLGAVAIVGWVVAVVDIVRRRAELRRGQLAAWILIVILVPVLGTVLYFAVGRRPARFGAGS
jgi:Phospholipase_D-nuclease N-terminal